LLTLRGPKSPRRGPLLNELNAIHDGAILIRDGLIAEVGLTRRLENLADARGADVIEANGQVVMPGFVDSHTHLVFPAATPDFDRAARLVRSSTGQRIEARARTYVEAMARHGTTTVEVKTGCGPDESAESKLLRVVSALRGNPLDIVSTFLCRLPQAGAADVAAWVSGELLPKVHRRKTAQFADLECSSDASLTAVYDSYLRTAAALGFPCKIHADSIDPSIAVDLALRHSVATIDHLEHVTEADAQRIGQAGMVVTLLPGASFGESEKSAPARSLIDAGAAVAIATDFNPFASPSLNMQTAIALSCLRLKMSVGEAISAATINGAHAVGCAERIGSLEPGKLADLVVLNLSDYRDLRHTLGTNMVHLTIKNGEVIYQEAEVVPAPSRPRLQSEPRP
jgi:imidazolonepropionase